jgi:hypothetical protein
MFKLALELDFIGFGSRLLLRLAPSERWVRVGNEGARELLANE